MSTAMTGRNIALDDYDALPDSTYRDRIEDVVVRVTNSDHVQKLLNPRGPLWPIDIFNAARLALDRDPETSQNALYFATVSSILCRALGALRTPLTPPATEELPAEDRHAMRKRIVSDVHQFPRHPLRVQVLRHMHLKWTIAMNSGHSGTGNTSEDSDEEELEWVLTRHD